MRSLTSRVCASFWPLLRVVFKDRNGEYDRSEAFCVCELSIGASVVSGASPCYARIRRGLPRSVSPLPLIRCWFTSEPPRKAGIYLLKTRLSDGLAALKFPGALAKFGAGWWFHGKPFAEVEYPSALLTSINALSSLRAEGLHGSSLDRSAEGAGCVRGKDEEGNGCRGHFERPTRCAFNAAWDASLNITWLMRPHAARDRAGFPAGCCIRACYVMWLPAGWLGARVHARLWRTRLVVCAWGR